MGWLGANPVVGLVTDPVLDTDPAETRLCKQNYSSLRDAVLQEGAWSFAKHFAQITTAETSANWAWSRVAPLSGLSPISLRVLTVDYRTEGGELNLAEWDMGADAIYTHHNPVYVAYIGQETDTTRFSPVFVEALAHRIAADLAIPLTESKQLQSQNWQLYMAKLELAEAIDGMQGRGQEHRATRYDKMRWGGARVS